MLLGTESNPGKAPSFDALRVNGEEHEAFVISCAWSMLESSRHRRQHARKVPHFLAKTRNLAEKRSR